MFTTTVKTGDLIPDFLHNHRLVPPGTKVHRGGYRYTCEAPGVFAPADRNSAGWDNYLWTYQFNLSQLPEGIEQLSLPDYDEDTLMWRIRDAALSAAERSSVRIEPVLTMLGQIGSTAPRFRLGEVISNSTDLKNLPDKAVLYSGDPSKAKLFTVYRMRHGEPTPILGQMTRRTGGQPVVLYEARGIDAAPSEPAAADKVAVARLAMKAWRIGKRFKLNQNWCGVFEETLGMLGIDEQVAQVAGETTRSAGEIVTKEQAFMLPVGTLLAWRWERGYSNAFALYRRISEATRNVSGTRRFFGHNDGDERNNHEQMQIVKMPGDEMRWPVPGGVINACPPGTRYHHTHHPDDVRVKVEGAQVENWNQFVIVGWPGVR